MLLTSGQVSVAISSVVVFLFTSALFLSGYVLQQQTVRDIRSAIRPKPVEAQARMYLPKQFEEQRAPVLSAEGNNEVVVNVMHGADLGPFNEKPTRQKTGPNPRYQPEAKPRSELDEKAMAAVEDIRPVQAGGPYDLPPASDPVGDLGSQVWEKQLSRAERRKKIKEEILAGGDGDGFKGYRRRMW